MYQSYFNGPFGGTAPSTFVPAFVACVGNYGVNVPYEVIQQNNLINVQVNNKEYLDRDFLANRAILPDVEVRDNNFIDFSDDGQYASDLLCVQTQRQIQFQVLYVMDRNVEYTYIGFIPTRDDVVYINRGRLGQRFYHFADTSFVLDPEVWVKSKILTSRFVGKCVDRPPMYSKLFASNLVPQHHDLENILDRIDYLLESAITPAMYNLFVGDLDGYQDRGIFTVGQLLYLWFYKRRLRGIVTDLSGKLFMYGLTHLALGEEINLLKLTALRNWIVLNTCDNCLEVVLNERRISSAAYYNEGNINEGRNRVMWFNPVDIRYVWLACNEGIGQYPIIYRRGSHSVVTVASRNSKIIIHFISDNEHYEFSVGVIEGFTFHKIVNVMARTLRGVLNGHGDGFYVIGCERIYMFTK